MINSSKPPGMSSKLFKLLAHLFLLHRCYLRRHAMLLPTNVEGRSAMYVHPGAFPLLQKE